MVNKAVQRLPITPQSDAALETLMNILQNAAIATMPIKTQPRNGTHPWNSEIKELMAVCKEADTRWKQASRPDSPHPLEINRRQNRKKLRSAV